MTEDIKALEKEYTMLCSHIEPHFSRAGAVYISRSLVQAMWDKSREMGNKFVDATSDTLNGLFTTSYPEDMDSALDRIIDIFKEMSFDSKLDIVDNIAIIVADVNNENACIETSDPDSSIFRAVLRAFPTSTNFVGHMRYRMHKILDGG